MAKKEKQDAVAWEEVQGEEVEEEEEREGGAKSNVLKLKLYILTI